MACKHVQVRIAVSVRMREGVVGKKVRSKEVKDGLVIVSKRDFISLHFPFFRTTTAM